MAPKLISFFLTLAVNVAAGVVVFFMLIVAMNGYSESDATWGIVAYIAAAILITLAMSALAAYLAGVFLRRGFSGFAAVALSVLAFSAAGVVLKAIAMIAAIAIAEIVRTQF